MYSPTFIYLPFKTWSMTEQVSGTNCWIVDTPIRKWYEKILKPTPININKHIIIQNLQTKF